LAAGLQVRFSDLFESFDADNSGTLEGPEVAQLVQALLPDVSQHELRYLWVGEEAHMFKHHVNLGSCTYAR
jgi:hypothetical protein